MAALRSILRHTSKSPNFIPLPRTTSRLNHTQTNSKQARFPPVLIAAAVLGTATYYALSPSTPKTLNPDTFTPYTITSKHTISPTSVIFTISPHQHDPSPPYLSDSKWKYPLWSVEFKQPEVQIARHYTPLPVDAEDGSLSFYIRAVGGGEMSNYLNRLAVGRDVYLRGPHAGFDILQRLGAQKDVVFLAGGTGVVPGMQVARAVLERDTSSRVKILWAVRKREELQGRQAGWTFWRTPTEVTSELEDASAMGERLARMKAKYGERLVIKVAVDEERTRFTERDVRDALAEGGQATPGDGCRLHDQRLHTRVSEFEEPGVPCECAASAGPGKNLLMVSGPDGFIAHYVGDKTWRGGTLTQGGVGGVAGLLQKRNPALANDWLVLKL